jgi:hypothetical protein
MDNCKAAVFFSVHNFCHPWVYFSFPQTLRTVVGPNLKQNLQTGCELSPVIVTESSFIRSQTKYVGCNTTETSDDSHQAK